jgi:histidinol-phosphate/aromatic aminotransferase/cobyric acid decarboxylase-like protein
LSPFHARSPLWPSLEARVAESLRAPSPRPEANLPAALHGSDAPAGVLDFSTGVSPLPPPPSIVRAIAAADVTRYPHPTALPLRAAAAEKHSVSPECIVAGAGSVELIYAAARAFAGVGRRVAWLAPAFAEYARAARASGAVEVAVERLDDPRVAECELAFAARPGNPTLRVPDVEHSRAALTIVDEAYQPLCDDVAPLPPTANRAILRSLTKVFALPGLRLGYLVASPDVARAVQAMLPPWNVSAPAQAAGIAALDEPPAPVRDAIAALRDRQIARLAAIGVTPRVAGAGFMLVDVGDGARVTRQLLTRGIRVRDCASFGLPECVRVGVGSDEDQARLVDAWRDLGGSDA